ncbi:nitronate monooxygenase [Mesorhizobium sp.]|uniref:nitronate monooxygenase n=1 Tax=Mesorhizobium sp. TaxID=1871066 RepID=UPI0025805440|nr:nitronate monooxygenase [Mesorhizobium sp.]
MLVVAQGKEAGGHSGHRSTFTLVPEIADLLAKKAPETLLVAAGGVGDGRALAAALLLGADGVLVGTRFIAMQSPLRRADSRRLSSPPRRYDDQDHNRRHCPQLSLADRRIRRARAEDSICRRLAWPRRSAGWKRRRWPSRAATIGTPFTLAMLRTPAF